MLFIRVLAMKCGNEECNYELVGFEEEYFLCPKCGNIIVENAVKVKSTLLIKNYAYEFQKKIKKLTNISECIPISVLALFFLLKLTLYGGLGVLTSDILKYEPRPSGFKMDLPPVIVVNIIYWVTEKKYISFCRKLFGYRYRVVRILLYIISTYLVFKYVEFIYLPYIVEHQRKDLPVDKLLFALKNEEFISKVMLIYGLVSHIIIDIIGIYVEDCAYKINREIKEYSSKY